MNRTAGPSWRSGGGGLGVVGVIAGRELFSRLRSKSFLLGTLVVLVLIGGVGVVNGLLASRSETTSVALTSQTAALADPVRAQAAAADVDLELSTLDAATAEQRVRDGDLDVAVTGTAAAPVLLGRSEVAPAVQRVVDGALSAQVLAAALRQAGADPAEVARRAADARSTERTLEDGQQTDAAIAVGIVSGVLIFLSFNLTGSLICQGVVEEKASRVVELVLSAVRPWQLLAGKVLGLGALGLLQLLVIGGVGAIVAGQVDSLPGLGSLAARSIVWLVVWYLLGYVLFAVLYAGAASLVSRQEDLQSVLTPLVFVLVVPFFVTVYGLPALGPDNRWISLLSQVPFFSPFLMPARIAAGAAPAWQIALSLLLAVLAAAAMTVLAGRIYRNSVLRVGGRVRVREALARA